MLIRSQDKNILTRFDSIAITTKYKRKDRNEREVVGKEIMAFSGVGADIIVGTYSTEEKAIKVLDMIQEEYLDTTNIYQGDYVTNCLPRAAVFQMPQNDAVELVSQTEEDCSNCENYTEPDEVDNGCYMCCKGFENNYSPKKQTNADYIRSATDEELADFIPCPYDTAGEPEEIMPCIRETGDSDFVSEKDCRRCRLEWLQKEAK